MDWKKTKDKKMTWGEMINQRDNNGNLTPLALALDAISDNGCDCGEGEDEDGTCMACRCENALKDLWSKINMAQPMKPAIKIKRLTETAKIPTYASDGAAGIDLFSDDDYTLDAGEKRLIHTGISIEIPPGFEGQIRPRSGLAANHCITVLNSPGTMDSDYRGEVMILLINHSFGNKIINRGDRIAQLVIAPVSRAKIEVVEELSDTERGDGGFGSTGK